MPTAVKFARVDAATSVRDLAALPGNRFESLVGDRKGQYSIRVNDQWRICLEWPDRTITRSIVMALTAIHPGEHLAEELEVLDMSPIRHKLTLITANLSEFARIKALSWADWGKP